MIAWALVALLAGVGLFLGGIIAGLRMRVAHVERRVRFRPVRTEAAAAQRPSGAESTAARLYAVKNDAEEMRKAVAKKLGVKPGDRIVTEFLAKAEVV